MGLPTFAQRLAYERALDAIGKGAGFPAHRDGPLVSRYLLSTSGRGIRRRVTATS